MTIMVSKLSKVCRLIKPAINEYKDLNKQQTTTG